MAIFAKPENTQNPGPFFNFVGTPYIRFLCYREIKRYELQFLINLKIPKIQCVFSILKGHPTSDFYVIVK